MPNVSFQPTAYQAEAEQIARSRKYAEALQAQSNQPLDPTQTAGGWVVPISPFQGFAKLGQAYFGNKGQNQADEKQKALAERLRQQGLADVQGFVNAYQGQPAKSFGIPANEMDSEASTGMQKPVAPDKQKALAIALGSVNPAVQGAGNAMLAEMLKGGESAFAKIDPSHFTSDSVKAFAATGGKDYSILVPRDKAHFADTGSGIVPLDPYTGKPVGQSLGKDIGPEARARLQWDQYTHTNPSAYQRAELGIQGANAGANLQRTQFETGSTGGNIAPRLAPMGQMPNFAQPIPGTTVPPAQSAPTPAQQPMPQQVMPRSPASMPQPTTQAPGLTPKAIADLAKEKALKDQDEARQLPNVIAKANQSIQNIDDMIGSANGKVAPHPGFQDVVGATWKPGMRFIPGTDAADFDKRLEQIKGQTFLQAFESLKGGGQITEIEGEKATAALNRMNRAQSEKEFVTAAREYQDVIRKGVERAQGRAGVNVPSQASTGKIRKYNPATGQIE